MIKTHNISTVKLDIMRFIIDRFSESYPQNEFLVGFT